MQHPTAPHHTAMALIDQGLADISGRTLISSDEVSNLLLDVRSAMGLITPLMDIVFPPSVAS